MEQKDLERFWSKVVKSDGCWTWVGTYFKPGAGAFSVGSKLLRASRISWELANGPIPSGCLVYRTCKNLTCIRPDHFSLGTTKDAIQHSVDHGKRANFKNGGKSRLSSETVMEIRRLAGEGVRDEELAERFKISRGYANNIVKNPSYFPHLPRGPERILARAETDLTATKNRERFWSKVRKSGEDECWIWEGTVHHTGRGCFKCGGEMHIASRVAWVLANGDVPDGLCACHKCDNPMCVNPKHLFLGTIRENNEDRHRKGRSASTSFSEPKLLPEIIEKIREEYKAGEGSSILGRRYGISRGTINRYVRDIVRPRVFKGKPDLSESDLSRFWSNIRKGEGCWEWIGSKLLRGLPYGTFTFTADGVRKTALAHRLSWMTVNGDIPNNLMVCHRCDNPLCINPDHLFLGTHSDNMKDMKEKGRSAHGDKSGRSILKSSDIPVITKRYENGESAAEIAADYGVSGATVFYAVKGKSWKSIKREECDARKVASPPPS